MNFNKSIIYLCLIVWCFAANMQARSFEVFVKGEGLSTQDGQPVAEYQVINIEGQYPDAADNPTYGQIRKGIAEAFGLDPHWRTFTIKYINAKTGKVYFLKPYIEKLSRKQRAAFFDKIARTGYMNMPSLVVARRGLKIQTARDISLQELEAEQQMGGTLITPEIGHARIMTRPVMEEEMTEPDWEVDETLVGESDPFLLEQLRAVKEKYE